MSLSMFVTVIWGRTLFLKTSLGNFPVNSCCVIRLIQLDEKQAILNSLQDMQDKEEESKKMISKEKEPDLAEYIEIEEDDNESKKGDD